MVKNRTGNRRLDTLVYLPLNHEANHYSTVLLKCNCNKIDNLEKIDMNSDISVPKEHIILKFQKFTKSLINVRMNKISDFVLGNSLILSHSSRLEQSPIKLIIGSPLYH